MQNLKESLKVTENPKVEIQDFQRIKDFQESLKMRQYYYRNMLQNTFINLIVLWTHLNTSKQEAVHFFLIQRFFHLFEHSGIKSISSDGIKFRSTPDSNDFVFVFVGMLFPTPRASRPLTLSRRFSLLQTLLIIDDKFQHLTNIYS